jgi:hypothetical protein
MWKLHVLLLVSCLPASARAAGWDLQFAEPYVLDRDVSVLDLDLDSWEAGAISGLKARGVTTLCYVSVGTLEDYREDSASFPAAVVGKSWPDWPDEKFLDVRQLDVLLPPMRARFERCRAKGFDAVEGDNQDVNWADSGFKISADDQIAYSKALAGIAHDLSLKMGQKNAPDLVPTLVSTMDFIVTEDCFADGWCNDVLPYRHAAKPVYAIEYTDTKVDFAKACAYGRKTGINFILKDRDLNGRTYQACEKGD